MMAQDCTTATATITFYRNGGSPTPPTPVYDDYYFSVASDKKVVFAPGNVYLNNDVLSFFGTQYEYKHNRDGYTDLFNYTTNTGYWSTKSINGDETGTWYNITKTEWEYLISESQMPGDSHRANANTLWGGARLYANDDAKNNHWDDPNYYKNGLIILPDNWILPSGSSFVAKASANSGNNKYTYDEWAVMEAAGAIFLPAAGSTSQDGEDNVCMIYMSDTANGPDNYYMMCSCQDFAPKWEGDGNVSNTRGSAVRLVRNAVLPVYEPYYFSVAADKKVMFAPGNVHYDGSAYTFLSNQYSYGRNASADNRDLFDFKSDWVSESINGDEAGKWNNLTKAEWEYLWNRSEDSHVMWTHAQIDNTYGLVLLPDDWNNTSGVTMVYGKNYEAGDWRSETENHYTVAQWGELEAIGAVFLPGAGNYTNCCDNNCAMYMSLTPTGGNYYLMCSCKDFAPKWEGEGGSVVTSYGAAVRPVRAAEIVTP